MARKLARDAAGYEGGTRRRHARSASYPLGAKLAARPRPRYLLRQNSSGNVMPLLTYAVATVATVKGFLIGAGLMAAALAAKRRGSAGR
jgi:hypothetical protein